MEEFQRLPGFRCKMVLCSSTNFRIWKRWVIISNFIWFDLGFWQSWKPFFRKLKYKEKVLEKFERFPRFPRKRVLYSSTNFCILKPWAISSNLVKFDLGFWQASKPFYRKLKCREKVLEEFQRFLLVRRTKVWYSSTNFCILKPWAIISNLIRFHWGFWQASKAIYRKLKYKEKVWEEFQPLPRFQRKIVLYLSTNFRILKPWAIISNFIRFDVAFWQASKPFYRKLKCREKVLEEFQRFLLVPRKMVLYSSTNFRILKPWAIISNIIRFYLGFWQVSKPFYRKLKYKAQILEEFQRWPRFPRKIVLCSSTNSRILKPWAITSNLIRFDLGFWQPWKSFYMKLKYRENVLEEFQRLPRFTRKMILYSWTNFRSLKPGAIISNFIRFDLVFWKTSKLFYRKLKYRQKVLEEFRRLPRFPRKMVLYSSTNFCSLKPWAIISNLIRFDLGFWQARNSYIGRGFWKSFNDPVAFPEKWFFYWSTNLRILKPCAIISNLIRFHLGFWQPWKPFYRKLKYREKVLEEFQRLPHFTRKIVLYSSTSFRLLKSWAFISNFIRFDLDFWQASKPF